MKILRNIGIVVLLAMVLLLVISMFLPADVHLEKSKVLKASPAAVFSQINNLKNWKKWDPWSKMDTTVKITYEGPEQGKDAKYSWNGEKIGSGSLWITESVPNQSVSTQLDFRDKGTGNANFKLEPAENNGTKVTWTFDSNMGNNPIHKFFGMIMKGMIGSQYEKGLNDLDDASSKAQADWMKQQQTMQVNTDTTGAKKDTMAVSKL